MPANEPLETDVASHFEFGENWAAYARTISREEIEHAKVDLQKLLSADEIRGHSFLDIGSGSGLHSLAALGLGATPVTAIDIDPESVATTSHTVATHSPGSNFQCMIGSILDSPFDDETTFDIVYSWGVLHHTGSMWDAIDNATRLVAPEGRLILAIYLKTRFCGFWRAEKRFFTSLAKPLRWPLVWLYSLLCVLRMLAKGENPISRIAHYNRNRGMSWYRDRVDWLGGYPYESATPEEIVDFVEHRGGHLQKAVGTEPSFGLLGSGCAEYVFRF